MVTNLEWATPDYGKCKVELEEQQESMTKSWLLDVLLRVDVE